MNKEFISASSLRCSARMKIREEWSRLKESDILTSPNDKQTHILAKKLANIENNDKKQNSHFTTKNIIPVRNTRKLVNKKPQTSDVLRGVVALVDVGSEPRALALRAALTALGATVVPKWSPLVTHLIWSQGGDRLIRAKARALACRLVSPLWVEACASSANRLPEQAFHAAPRDSDLPSPRTLKQMLKKADMENLTLGDLLSDSKEEQEAKEMRLRISSETERNTSSDVTNTTRDTTLDKSKDKSHDKSDTTDIESRVNTAPRRLLPMSLSTSPQISKEPKKSKRKLFTQKEPDLSETDDDSEAENRVQKTQKSPIRPRVVLTQRERRDLARAERMARDMLAACTRTRTRTHAPRTRMRIVLTGMNSSEKKAVSTAVRSLGGRIQSAVDKNTTHVLLGSCKENINNNDITGVTAQSAADTSFAVQSTELQKPRTLNALLGAARGCRVLHAQWALDSAADDKWRHHAGYEVAHLKKISQKARVERTALGLQRSEYCYDVFAGTRVLITNEAQQRDAAIQLLTICGATAIDAGLYQNGGATQNGGAIQNGGLLAKSQNGRIQDGRPAAGDFDVRIGVEPGEVNSKWVFDSVASARMRTTRRYVNSG